MWWNCTTYLKLASIYIVELAILVRGWQRLGKSLVGSAVELNYLYKETA